MNIAVSFWSPEAGGTVKFSSEPSINYCYYCYHCYYLYDYLLPMNYWLKVNWSLCCISSNISSHMQSQTAYCSFIGGRT